ncbi:uncharacterized protein LOC110989248 isoform X2 [Acanthaster planci]|uniref:Uncharacterized protein LOC110989248 isoform X2 n=1 Tax=Acanthaster planci TaxID=133434 RepID=A0A8B7ZVR6_ACAPL|nr:uncharacterized protein LOC110989248 isoform X2 [Acanthaster planci]
MFVWRNSRTRVQCHSGLLYLKKFEDPTKLSQLVFYDRPDTTGPKLSKFSLAELHHPEQLKTTLSLALGVKGIVKKTRTLIMVGQTRVHIDEVEGLGSFMELEVMMQPQQTSADGTKIADELMEQLGIQSSDLISGAYMDLILQQNVEGNCQ